MDCFVGAGLIVTGTLLGGFWVWAVFVAPWRKR